MEQSSSIHRLLSERSKAANWPYMSSILMVNRNVPLFEEQYGQLDYEWTLEATRGRRCAEVSPCVIRYIDGSNLSHDHEYRRRDFYAGLLTADGNRRVMKRWFASYARYHYVAGNARMARFFFIRGTINWKTMLYWITSFLPPLRKFIIRKFGVFG